MSRLIRFITPQHFHHIDEWSDRHINQPSYIKQAYYVIDLKRVAAIHT